MYDVAIHCHYSVLASACVATCSYMKNLYTLHCIKNIVQKRLLKIFDYKNEPKYGICFGKLQ